MPQDTLDTLADERGEEVEVPRAGKMDWKPLREKIAKNGMRKIPSKASLKTSATNTPLPLVSIINTSSTPLLVARSGLTNRNQSTSSSLRPILRPCPTCIVMPGERV